MVIAELGRGRAPDVLDNIVGANAVQADIGDAAGKKVGRIVVANRDLAEGAADEHGARVHRVVAGVEPGGPAEAQAAVGGAGAGEVNAHLMLEAVLGHVVAGHGVVVDAELGIAGDGDLGVGHPAGKGKGGRRRKQLFHMPILQTCIIQSTRGHGAAGTWGVGTLRNPSRRKQPQRGKGTAGAKKPAGVSAHHAAQ